MSQPIRVGGYPDDAMKENFMRWAAANLSPGDLHRVKEIDRTYRDTATLLALMKPEDVDEEDLTTAMQKWKIKHGR
jgi:hypothetical protein